MYTPTHLPETQALTDFREHTAQVLKKLTRTNKPLLITQKGKAAGIVMSPKAYERLADAAALAHSVAGVRESMAQFAAGRGIPADEVFGRLERAIRSKAKRKPGRA